MSTGLGSWINAATAVIALASTTGHAEVRAVYAPVTQAKYQGMAESFQRGRVPEGVAAVLNSRIRLPGQLLLVAAECGKPNAAYMAARRAIVLCYELLEQVTTGIIGDFSNAPSEDQGDIAAGTIFFVLFHEIGHALVHVLNLPIFAREEDIVDAIATYFLLEGPKPVHGIVGAAWFFRQRDIQYTVQHFADEHSLPPQRQLNIVCLAFGKDSKVFGGLAQRMGLSRERAVRCAAEYARLEASVRQQLGRHLLR